jgi:hypothetical protein
VQRLCSAGPAVDAGQQVDTELAEQVHHIDEHPVFDE